MFWAIPIVALGVLAWYVFTLITGRLKPAAAKFTRGAGDGFSRPTRVDLATGVALIVLAVAVNTSFLRGGLLSRFGDAIVPVALLGAWATTAAPGVLRVRGVPAAIAWAAPRALLVVFLVCFFVAGQAGRELQAGGFFDSWENAERRFQVAKQELAQLPPETWSGVNAGGHARRRAIRRGVHEP